MEVLVGYLVETSFILKEKHVFREWVIIEKIINNKL